MAKPKVVKRSQQELAEMAWDSTQTERALLLDMREINPTGSSMKSLGICPSWRPTVTGNRNAADEGSLLHAGVEHRSIEGLDAFQAPLVKQCIVLEDAETVGADEVFREVKLGKGAEDGMTYGVIDTLALFRKTRHAKVLDWKFGRIPVDDAEQNEQGYTYVVNTFREYPWVESVMVLFAQPRLDYITEHTFYRPHQPGLEAHLQSIKLAALLPEEARMKRFNSGNCCYCRNLYTCDAAARVVQQMAITYGGDPRTEEMPKKPIGQCVTGADFAEHLMFAKVMENWVDAVKTNAFNFRAAGHEIPGYELRERNDGRKLIPGAARDAQDIVSARLYEIIAMYWTGHKDFGLKNAQVGQLVESMVDANLGRVLEIVRDLTPDGKKDTEAAKTIEVFEAKGLLNPRGSSVFLARSNQ